MELINNFIIFFYIIITIKKVSIYLWMGMYFYIELLKKNFLELTDPLSIIIE